MQSVVINTTFCLGIFYSTQKKIIINGGLRYLYLKLQSSEITSSPSEEYAMVQTGYIKKGFS